MAVTPGSVIDADGHVRELAEEVVDFCEGRYRHLKRFRTFAMYPTLDGWFRGAQSPDMEDFVTPARWLEFMDTAGIETAVLYPTAGLAAGLIQDRDWACAITRAYNDWLHARFLAESPRFRGVALLPVQDIAEAARELRRATQDLGMVAGMLPAMTVLNKPYGHPDFYPLYDEAARLDVGLAFHGAPSKGLGFDYFDTFIKVHTLSHPVSQFIQFTSLVLDGILELYPTVRFAFLESGAGWVPYFMDRMDTEYGIAWARAAKLLKKKPSEYIRQGNVYVTCELEESTLPLVAERLGAGQIMYPSDFPHERAWAQFMHDLPEFREREDLSDAVKQQVLHENPRRFYRL